MHKPNAIAAALATACRPVSAHRRRGPGMASPKPTLPVTASSVADGTRHRLRRRLCGSNVVSEALEQASELAMADPIVTARSSALTLERTADARRKGRHARACRGAVWRDPRGTASVAAALRQGPRLRALLFRARRDRGDHALRRRALSGDPAAARGRPPMVRMNEIIGIVDAYAWPSIAATIASTANWRRAARARAGRGGHRRGIAARRLAPRGDRPADGRQPVSRRRAGALPI